MEEVKRCRTCGDVHPIEALCERKEMSVKNARARFGSGGSRDLDEPVGKESLMDSINERTRRQQQGLPLNLPPADPWDRQTGVRPVDEFQVGCTWIPVNDDWAEVRATIVLHDGEYDLMKPVQMRRVQGGRSVPPELVCAAWIKKAVSAGGVPVLGLHEDSPGHAEFNTGAWYGRWWATVGSRLSVAVVRLDGNLAGQARLVLVE